MMRALSRRRNALVAVLFSLGLLVIFYRAGFFPHQIELDPLLVLERNYTTSSPHRKLLGREMEPDRIWGERCSKSDIVVNQGPTAPLPNGIPTYTVEIMNVCANGCDISGIHFSCGWFSSARLINPKVFKRISYDDCLVNDGKSLVNGGTLSFQYANTFRYPLFVSSVTC